MPASVTRPNAQLADPKIEARVTALLKQMTLEEKIGQLVQYSATEPETKPGAHLAVNPNAAGDTVQTAELAATGRLGSMLNTVGKDRTNEYQHLAVEKSRLHIPLLFGADVIHGYRTIYQVPLGLAASWDPDIVAGVAHMAAEEAVTAGIRWVYSPMVDISRDARWGRSTEGAGEDAYLGSAMARAYVRGYQGDDLAKPDAVAVSVKHYAAYGAAEAGREYNTTDMSEISLRQNYLPPYKAAVEAGAATMMSAFNSLNGVPSTANPFLMTKILRGEWHFDGFVVSDYTAVEELTNHGIALTAADATAKAITAGVDVDMMSHFYDAELPGLVKSGRVPMVVVDEAVRRVLRVKFALGVFEHPYAEAPEVTAAVPEHRPLARKAAEESFVLLKNERGVLPLASGKKIALIGPLGDDAEDMTGAWGGGGELKDVVTLKAALEARGTVTYVKGTDLPGIGTSTIDPQHSTGGFAAAVEAARSADIVIAALGESGIMSGEAGSRAHLDLPGNQEQLLEAVAATGKPVVLVVFSGRPLVLDWAALHVPAILEAWFPGVEAGPALADVLFGDTAPSGKLPMSFPRAVGQEPLYYNQLPTGRPADIPAVGSSIVPDLTRFPDFGARFHSRYIDVPNDALFPFGHGLSYTTFSYSPVKLSRTTLSLNEAGKAGPLVTATTTVTNSGSRPGTEVVQCYVRNLGASVEQPVRSLKGFSRVTLAPGESKEVSFPLGFAELSFYNVNAKAVVEPTHYTVWIGGSSLASEKAAFTVSR
jgi:beta-glucosidase